MICDRSSLAEPHPGDVCGPHHRGRSTAPCARPAILQRGLIDSLHRASSAAAISIDPRLDALFAQAGRGLRVSARAPATEICHTLPLLERHGVRAYRCTIAA